MGDVRSGGGYSGSLAFLASVRFTSSSSNRIEGLMTVVGNGALAIADQRIVARGDKIVPQRARIQFVEFRAAHQFLVAVFFVNAIEQARLVSGPAERLDVIAERLAFLAADIDQFLLQCSGERACFDCTIKIPDARRCGLARAQRGRGHSIPGNREWARGRAR